jgi:hypothetical protein
VAFHIAGGAARATLVSGDPIDVRIADATQCLRQDAPFEVAVTRRPIQLAKS